MQRLGFFLSPGGPLEIDGFFRARARTRARARKNPAIYWKYSRIASSSVKLL